MMNVRGGEVNNGYEDTPDDISEGSDRQFATRGHQHKDEQEQCTYPMTAIWIILSLIYLAMMVFGAVYFHDCVDTHMAIYTIVQGVSVMISTLLCAIGTMYVKASDVAFGTAGIIFLFNLIWGGVGIWWIMESPTQCNDTTLYKAAVGFSVPIWVMLAIIWLMYKFSRCLKYIL